MLNAAALVRRRRGDVLAHAAGCRIVHHAGAMPVEETADRYVRPDLRERFGRPKPGWLLDRELGPRGQAAAVGGKLEIAAPPGRR